MNISENKRLVPSIAEQLIIELFAGQTKELNEIKTKVTETHTSRGGLQPTTQIHPVERALNNLKREGKAEKPQLVYWKIQATEEQITNENTIKTLDEFNAWVNQFKEGEYVFRGVPNKAYKIQASAYRRSEENDRNFVKFLHANKDLVRTARQRGYDHKDGAKWSDLDILVQLQHYGAATCLIDFSYSAQVALWFACRDFQIEDANGELDNTNKPSHGKVSAVKIIQPKYTEITPDFMKGKDEKGEDGERKDENSIDFFLNEDTNSQLYYLQPKFQNNRIIAQQSVLLFGNYEIDAENECFIDGECKGKILSELERTSGYTEERLFPDFEGFAWVNREDATYTATTFQANKDLGQYAYENKQYRHAIDYFTQALNIDPNYAELYYIRGNVYVSNEENEKAFEDFDRAIDLKFDPAELYLSRGDLFLKQGRYSDAISDFDTAIDKKADYGEAYYRRGQSKYHLEQMNDALTDFDSALHLQPNSPYVHYWSGLAKQQLGQVEEALTDFTEAIRLKPDYFDAYYQSGILLKELQEYPSAIDEFSKAIELNPNEIAVFYNRSVSFFYLRNIDEARQDLQVALDLAIQQENREMVAEINALFQDVLGYNISEDEDE